MQSNVRAAAVQMNSREDKAANVATATRLVEEAAAEGAELVALPEMFNCLGRFETIVAAAEPVPGPTSDAMSALAAKLGVYLCAGSLAERAETVGKAYNTSLLFGPGGELLAKYRKIHLFDVDLPEVHVCESQFIEAGTGIVVTDTPLGRLGQATCYDLRFGNLFDAFARAKVEIILLPSAFTRTTGRDHWEILVRARAIENQAYVVAPNQFGQHTKELFTFGHAAVVDPWGSVLAIGDGDHEEVLTADLSAARMNDVRTHVPALVHRRTLASEVNPGR